MENLKRLHRLGAMMRLGTCLCAALTIIGGIWYCIGFLTDPDFAQAFGREVAQGPITITPVSAGITVLLLEARLGIVLAALYCVWRMFDAFSADEPLSLHSARWITRAGVAFLAIAVGNIVLETAMALALTYGNPRAKRS